MNTSLFKLAGEYLKHLQLVRKASQLTIRNYKHYLNRFLDFLQNSFPDLSNPDDLNQNVVNNYKAYLSRYADNRGIRLSETTQAYHLIALRSFLKFIIKRGIQTINPELVIIPQGEARLMKFLNNQQLKQLLSFSDNVRDRTIIELLVSTGLRVSDLVRLNRSGINLEKKQIELIDKGKKSRLVFLTESAVYWLLRYLSRRDDDSDALFIRKAGKKGGSLRLTPRSIQRIIEKYVKKANIPVKATPHTFRHTFAINLLIGKTNIHTIQKNTRNINTSTLQIYTKVFKQ